MGLDSLDCRQLMELNQATFGAVVRALTTTICFNDQQNDMAISKVVTGSAAACSGVQSGMTLMLGGFGLCGIPEWHC